MYIIFIFTFFWLSIICKYASLSDCIMSQENSYVKLNNNIRPKGSKTNKVIANTPVTSSVIAHTNKTIIPNYVTMSIYSPNYVNLTTYLRYRNRKKTIIFKPKPRAGVANNLRSIRGLMMIAMANNANFCIKYPDFFTIMEDSFGFLSCLSNLNTIQWNHDYAVNWAKKSECNFQISHSLEIQTSDDLSSPFHKCRNFFNVIKDNTHTEKSRSLYQYLSNYIFKPKKYIVDYAEEVLAKMKGIKVGVQLRFGGKTAASQEQVQFLDPNHINYYINQILNVTSKINTRYTLFLSTDSPSMKKYLSPLNVTIVTAEKYSVGHTNRYKLEFLQRAITDIYILSRCDIYLHSQGSSYGSFASAISVAKADYIIQRKQSFVCCHTQWHYTRDS